MFDRSAKGTIIPAQFVEIERGRIAFFSKSIGETNPIHFNRAAARKAGYPDVVAPITFPIVILMSVNEALQESGDKTAFDRINCDYRRLLHGAERYEYHGQIFAGDEVSVLTTVLDFEDKKGGAIELAHLKTTISHLKRGLLVEMISTAIHRLG